MTHSTFRADTVSFIPPSVLAPVENPFERRAERLLQLAPGHALEAWLTALGRLSDAQQHFFMRLRESLSQTESAPLPQEMLAAMWRAWISMLEGSDWPFSGQLQPLKTLDDDGVVALSLKTLARAKCEAEPVPLGVADLLMGMALQIAWTLHAAKCSSTEKILQGNRYLCPCCGSAPVGGLILAGDGKAGLRYLECSLCATRWNAVRARCVVCEAIQGLSYRGLEGGSKAVQAETCDHCKSYIKTLFQDRDAQVIVTADDLATLTLDVLVGELGYLRASPNLLLLEGLPG